MRREMYVFDSFLLHHSKMYSRYPKNSTKDRFIELRKKYELRMVNGFIEKQDIFEFAIEINNLINVPKLTTTFFYCFLVSCSCLVFLSPYIDIEEEHKWAINNKDSENQDFSLYYFFYDIWKRCQEIEFPYPNVHLKTYLFNLSESEEYPCNAIVNSKIKSWLNIFRGSSEEKLVGKLILDVLSMQILIKEFDMYDYWIKYTNDITNSIIQLGNYLIISNLDMKIDMAQLKLTNNRIGTNTLQLSESNIIQMMGELSDISEVLKKAKLVIDSTEPKPEIAIKLRDQLIQCRDYLAGDIKVSKLIFGDFGNQISQLIIEENHTTKAWIVHEIMQSVGAIDLHTSVPGFLGKQYDQYWKLSKTRVRELKEKYQIKLE